MPTYWEPWPGKTNATRSLAARVAEHRRLRASRAHSGLSESGLYLNTSRKQGRVGTLVGLLLTERAVEQLCGTSHRRTFHARRVRRPLSRARGRVRGGGSRSAPFQPAARSPRTTSPTASSAPNCACSFAACRTDGATSSGVVALRDRPADLDRRRQAQEGEQGRASAAPAAARRRPGRRTPRRAAPQARPCAQRGPTIVASVCFPSARSSSRSRRLLQWRIAATRQPIGTEAVSATQRAGRAVDQEPAEHHQRPHQHEDVQLAEAPVRQLERRRRVAVRQRHPDQPEQPGSASRPCRPATNPASPPSHEERRSRPAGRCAARASLPGSPGSARASRSGPRPAGDRSSR